MPRAQVIRPEDRLLLLAAAGHAPSDHRGEAEQALPAATDWEALAAAATRHGLLPLLHRWLATTPLWEAAPTSFRLNLERLARATALTNLKAKRELRAVLLLAHDQGVQALALKGAALTELVYPDSALRPMADVDLLVRREAVEPMRAALEQAGYEVPLPPAPVHPSYWEHEPGVCCSRPGSPVVLDLHWDLDAARRVPFRLETAEIWRRARTTTLAGAPAWIMAPEDLLVHLCLHQFRHADRTLMRHCDLAYTLRRYAAEMDWKAVVERSRGMGAGWVVGRALLVAREVLDAPVPAGVVEALLPEWLVARIRRGLPEDLLAADPVTTNRWAILSRQLPLLPGIGARLRFVWQIAFPPPLAAAGGAPSLQRSLRRALAPARLRRAGGWFWRFVLRRR